MDEIVYGLDLPNEVAVQNIEMLAKKLKITDDEINFDKEENNADKETAKLNSPLTDC